jgi:hypothetical protein
MSVILPCFLLLFFLVLSNHRVSLLRVISVHFYKRLDNVSRVGIDSRLWWDGHVNIAKLLRRPFRNKCAANKCSQSSCHDWSTSVIDGWASADRRVNLTGFLWLPSSSQSLYNWQCVLVLSPVLGSWPDVWYCLTFAVVSMWGTLSDNRSGFSFVSHSLKYLVICQYVHKSIYILHVSHDKTLIMYVQHIQELLSVHARYSRLCIPHHL